MVHLHFELASDLVDEYGGGLAHAELDLSAHAIASTRRVVDLLWRKYPA